MNNIKNVNNKDASLEQNMNDQLAQQKMEQECQLLLQGAHQHPDQYSIFHMMKSEFVSCHAARQEVVVRFPVEAWQMNPNKTFHGGLIATCYDMVYGLLVRVLTNNGFIATIDLSVSYLRPIPVGESFVVVAKATHVGRTVARVNAEAYVNDVLVGTSTGSFILMHKKSES